jgi:trehalose/maltose hydrolase-like predicted phosphorylase
VPDFFSISPQQITVVVRFRAALPPIRPAALSPRSKLIALLPEEFSGAMAEKNFRYYEPRCAHGSSLGTGMHALVAARLGDAAMALHYLRATAASDLDFDPNSAGGVRVAGLGALWQAVILGFAGLDLKGDMLGVDPRLPPQWRSRTQVSNI